MNVLGDKEGEGELCCVKVRGRGGGGRLHECDG